LEPEIFKIFRSSAGSGKTYRLAVEYIKLALQDSGDFRRILAVTFTNKATNEMKARIIEYLFKISSNEANNDLVETLCNELELDEMQLKDRAKKTLRKLLHGYSYFSVSTIDSFFQRVISAFARDLGIQGGYHLEFELDRVKEEVIDKLFTGLDAQPDLRKWLVQFTILKIESNKSWDIRYDIRQLAGQMFFESFSVYYDALSKKISGPVHLSDVLRNIRAEREKIKLGFEEMGRRGVDIIRESGLGLPDFSRGINGPAGLFYKMASGQQVSLTSSYLTNALYSVNAWFTKKSVNHNIIIRMLEDGLQELFESTYDYYKKEIIKDNTYEEVQKHFYNLGILSNLIEGLKEYREENEVILVSDLTHLLRIVVGENDAPFIYEKAGSFYNHFLIDEFQDTSHYQWANFLPLVLNSLSAGKFNMIVGDVKQSIYRWRGGDWEILQNQVETDVEPYNFKVEPLTANWRSLKNIVSFNNTLFKSLPGLFNLKFSEEVNKVSDPELRSGILPFSDRFEAAYTDVEQHLPEKKYYSQDGMIEVKFLPDSADGPDSLLWKEKVMSEIVERVKVLQDHQYLLKDIAILVRTKDEGRGIANYLLDYKNSQVYDPKYRFDVISSESLFLKTSPVVNVIISFIRLVINPADLVTTANFYYWLSILKSKNEDIDYGHIFQTSICRDLLSDLNEQLLGIKDFLNFANYRSVPVIDLIEEISLLLKLDEHKEEGAYFLGLQNAVLEYLESNNNDLHAFITWWANEGESKSIKPSLEQDAINILTIHQAKGLEFKAVLIPFCSWEVDHSSKNENIIWAGSSLPALDQIPYYPLRYSKKLSETHFINRYFNEKSLAYMDNLNLLYVAFTRAEEGLFVYSELPRDLERRKTVGDMLLQFFVSRNAEGESVRNLMSGKDGISYFSRDINLKDCWHEEEHVFRLGRIGKKEISDRDAAMFSLDDYAKGKWQDKITIRRQADIFLQETTEEPGEAINYGILLHDILSRIHTIEQAEPVLIAEEYSGNITKADRQKLSLKLEELWKIDRIHDWFSGNWEVKTEVPVLPEKGSLSRMDRVMIKGRNAIVVDYKTGVRRYADVNQVKGYMNILEKMGYEKVEGYVLYLADLKLTAI